jgi:type I restriction enzyme S subunit
LNVAEVRAFEIPVPSVDEQRAITESLDALEQKIASEKRNMQKLVSMKSGLMDDLLTGRVRVPLDTKAAA